MLCRVKPKAVAKGTVAVALAAKLYVAYETYPLLFFIWFISFCRSNRQLAATWHEVALAASAEAARIKPNW